MRTIQDLELVIGSKRLPGVKCAVVVDVEYDPSLFFPSSVFLRLTRSQAVNVTPLLRDPDIRELIEREIAAYERAECIE